MEQPPPGGTNGFHPHHNMGNLQLGANHLPGQQEFESQSLAPQYLVDSTSNPTHLSNGNWFQIDNQNSGRDMVENFSRGIPNHGDCTRPDQLLDSMLTFSSENYNTTSYVPLTQVPENGGSSNFNHVESMQPYSNGLQCRVQPDQGVDVGNEIRSNETNHYMTRLKKLLDSESSDSHIPILSSSKIFQLCSNVTALLEDDDFKWEKSVHFTELVELPADTVKDQLIKHLLGKKLRVWLLQKIVEGGRGADVLDEKGQGVLHLVAALGYDWAIEAILAANILSIDLEDVKKCTALDWASLMGRYHTVKLLKSRGATPRSAAEPITNDPSHINSDFSWGEVESMAIYNWLPHDIICQILCNHHKYPIKKAVPREPPPSGSIFLLDRKKEPKFQTIDGHVWKKGCRSEIKRFDLRINYARGKQNKRFVRRWYEMMKEKSDIILIHYLNVDDKASNSSRKDGSNLNGDQNSNDNPDSGEEHPHDYPHFGQSNGVNQRVWSNTRRHQNSYNNGSGRSRMQGSLTPEGSSESSCNENLHVEDKENYSSSKQLPLDEQMHEFELIDIPDCGSNNQLEDVAQKTIQKGTVGCEDKDGENTGLVTDPCPTPNYSSRGTPENRASSSRHEVISFCSQEPITLLIRRQIIKIQGELKRKGREAVIQVADDQETNGSEESDEMMRRVSKKVCVGPQLYEPEAAEAYYDNLLLPLEGVFDLLPINISIWMTFRLVYVFLKLLRHVQARLRASKYKQIPTDNKRKSAVVASNWLSLNIHPMDNTVCSVIDSIDWDEKLLMRLRCRRKITMAFRLVYVFLNLLRHVQSKYKQTTDSKRKRAVFCNWLLPLNIRPMDNTVCNFQNSITDSTEREKPLHFRSIRGAFWPFYVFLKLLWDVRARGKPAEFRQMTQRSFRQMKIKRRRKLLRHAHG